MACGNEDEGVTTGNENQPENENQPRNNPKNPDSVPDGTYIALWGYAVDGASYTINPNTGTACYNFPHNGDSVTTIIVPQQIEVEGKTYTVTQIRDNAFSGLHQLTSVTLPSSINYIGKNAFSCCEKLAAINLPEGLESIKIYTFNECTSLTSITLPKSLTSIENFAFCSCRNLSTITLPSTLKTIGQEAFKGCGLTDIVIPDGVTELGLESFANCKSLTSISVPANIMIYEAPFNGCDALTSVAISCRFVLGEFGPNLTELILGEGVQTIGTDAFRGSHQLKNVTCYAVNPPYIQADEDGYSPAFERETQENGTLCVPSTSLDAYKTTPGWSGFKTIVAIQSF
ncbi:MAG: leucine-rich repeat domain-containing protein [Prevotella sp.]|nr:leucine-rich repeat domain-containing protein [Prevotella sp.]